MNFIEDNLDIYGRLFPKSVAKIKFSISSAKYLIETDLDGSKDAILINLLNALYHTAKLHDHYIKKINRYSLKNPDLINEKYLISLEENLLTAITSTNFDLSLVFKFFNKKKLTRGNYAFKIEIIDRINTMIKKKTYIPILPDININYGKFFINVCSNNFFPVKVVDANYVKNPASKLSIIISQFNAIKQILITPIDNLLLLSLKADSFENTLKNNYLFFKNIIKLDNKDNFADNYIYSYLPFPARK